MTQEDIVKTQEIFAKKLRGLLDENKINQSELAEMLQVSESTVGKWLLKKALPRMGIIEKLSSIFNCPKSYLLEENETRRSYYLNPEAAKMAQEIYDNPQYKVLFDATKKLKPESIKLITKKPKRKAISMSRTILYDLPHDVRGFVREDIDGEAIFILNARLTRESNIKTYLHEQEHYEKDCGKNLCVNEIEAQRHK